MKPGPRDHPPWVRKDWFKRTPQCQLATSNRCPSRPLSSAALLNANARRAVRIDEPRTANDAYRS